MENSRLAGTGRVIIPSDVPRSEYLNRCYGSGRVAIYTDGAGVIRQASVCIHCINDIVFPDDPSDFGSAVRYIKDPSSEEYTVYGVVKEIDSTYNIMEHQFSLGRTTSDGISMIAGDPNNGTMVVTVNHNKKGGNLVINVGNDDSISKIFFNICGDYEVDANSFDINAYDRIRMTLPKGKTGEVTTIEYEKGKGFNYFDEFGNIETIDKDTHTINHKKKVIFGDDKYSAMFYEEFESFMSDFITEVSKGTTATVMGAMPLLNAAVIASYVGKLKAMKMKSNYVKLK